MPFGPSGTNEGRTVSPELLADGVFIRSNSSSSTFGGVGGADVRLMGSSGLRPRVVHVLSTPR